MQPIFFGGMGCGYCQIDGVIFVGAKELGENIAPLQIKEQIL